MGAGAAAQHGQPSDVVVSANLRRMWPPGSRCVVHGLQSPAGQQLNGRPAEVRGLDERTGRLMLRLDPQDEASKWKKVKPENAHWQGPTFTTTGEHHAVIEEIQALVRQAAGCAGAVEAGVLSHLQAKLHDASEKIPEEDFRLLDSFVEQSRRHASQWLTYHELRVKPDLKLEGPHGVVSTADPRAKQLAEQVAAVMKRAYWDKAREDFAKPRPDFSFMLVRTDELVETMASFLPVARRAAFKERAVDWSMLRMQVDNNAFDYKSLIDLARRLGSALMELESPFQSACTKKWLDKLEAKPVPDDAGFLGETVDCLAYLFEKVDVLRVDLENFGLQYVRATQLQDLERDVFSRMVNIGLLSVDVTRSWLAATEHGGNVEVAVIRGMASLLTLKTALPQAKCPEPLRCDLQSLQGFQSGLQGVVLLAMVAIVTGNFLPGGVSVDKVGALFRSVAEEMEKPTPQLSQISEIVEQGVVGLRHEHGAVPVDCQEMDKALRTLRTCLGEDVPAFSLLHDRACKAFVAALGPPKKHPPDGCLGESPWSLRYAVEHLRRLVDNVWTFLGEHLRVYKPVYSGVLSGSFSSVASGC